MATVREMMLDMMDAAASVETAAMMSAGDTFEGNITRGDEDWIAIELSEGHMYTITVGGGMGDMELNDSVLMLLDSKGAEIMMNDDKDGAKGDLSSEIKFTPESGTGTQLYYISVSGSGANPGNPQTGTYTLSVTAVEVLPAGEGADIEATSDADHKLTGTDDAETIAGMGGNDVLIGLDGDDTLDGGGGNDLLNGGPGADTLKGGAGDDDTVSYADSEAGVTINLSDGTARGGDADGDTIVDTEAGDRVENIMGSAHDDVLTGNRYDNDLWGLGGNDELNGLRGDDKLYGGPGDDMLDGGRNTDILEGGYGADELTGGDGNDTASYASSMYGVTVRLHSQQAMGGDAEGDTFGGHVTVEYTVADEDGDETDHEAMLPDIMNLTGSAMADILAGDMRDNTIMGGAGDDTIYGGPSPKGATGDGDDTNADMLHGQGGDDMIFGGAGDDTLDGGAGNDKLVGGPGDDTYYGGAGSDMIYADNDDATINGWVMTPPENDAATPDVDESTEAGSDPMTSDTVSYARVENEAETGVTKTLNDPGGTTAAGGTTITNVENIIGTPYDDELTGSNQDNVIEGGAGRDTLDGGTNGDGGDTLSYASSDDWVRVTLAAAGTAATVSRGHARGDTATNFENVMGSAHDDELTGNDDANVLTGGDGDDDLEGEGGNDTLEGGAGADELHGGYSDGGTAGAANTEMNRLSYASSDAGVMVNLATASVSGGHAEGDTIETYEELAPTADDAGNEIDVTTFRNVTGSMHDDRLTGDHHDNELVGGAGDDTLRGGASQRGDGSTAAIIRGDVLVGGPGADVLDGGEDRGEGDNNMVDTNKDGLDNDADGEIDEDDEVAMVAGSVDWAVYKHAMEGVAVNLATNMGTGGEAMGDTLRNIELVWGSEKDDTFISGPGPDNIEGDGGSDTVSYEASELAVTVDLSVATAHRTVAVTGTVPNLVFPVDADPAAVARPTDGVLSIPENHLDDDTTNDTAASDDNPETNGAAGDRLGSIENVTGSGQKDVLTGDANPNVLKGMGGDDTLNGGDETIAGAGDTLYGGAGEDMLNGGGGADTLNGGADNDTLNGGDGDDTLDGGAGNDDLTGAGGVDTFVFGPGGGSDVAVDFRAAGAGDDMIDLRAFGLTAEELKPLISIRAGNTIINLEDHGGGRITIQDQADLDIYDIEADDADNDIDTLSLANDYNGDGDFVDTLDETADNMDYNMDGDMDDTAVTEAGVFIL